MKTFMLAVSLLLLAGCFGPRRAFEQDPAGFGLYVASTNIASNSDLVVQQEGTGKDFRLKNMHSSSSGDTAYIMIALPPGRYHLELYSPDGVGSYPVATDNGWFEVQANCYNYGGYYEFQQQGANGLPTYKNTTTLQDIQNLPAQYKDPAQSHDICSADMGHASERLAAADVAKVMPSL
ncbi:MAG TPA: hypothetical protein VH327_02110 [Gammaproteobacteria bacterium]|jgi:hypothetical protein|nr:hypothetical protein [Gammaproteobacteria bacterium]